MTPSCFLAALTVGAATARRDRLAAQYQRVALNGAGWQVGSQGVSNPTVLHTSSANAHFLSWLPVLPVEGFYTYFASEAVSFGANPANWPELAAWARQHGRLFIPSVGPGYDDSRIRRGLFGGPDGLTACRWGCKTANGAALACMQLYASAVHYHSCLAELKPRPRRLLVTSLLVIPPSSRPWNAAATRSREGGARYRRWWQAALAVQPAAVSITSYNEWGELALAAVWLGVGALVHARTPHWPNLPSVPCPSNCGYALCGNQASPPHLARCAGEGTQIEPAKVFPAPNGSSTGSSSADADGSNSSGGGGGGGEQHYQSYGGQPRRDEWLYMSITAEYALQLQQQQGTAEVASPGPQHTEL